MVVEGLETREAGRDLLTMVLTHATSPSFTYFHAWDAGDVVVWDAVRKSNCRGAFCLLVSYNASSVLSASLYFPQFTPLKAVGTPQ